MTVHPRLVRSIPFWALIAGSAAAIGGGTYLLVDRLSTMESALLDGTATGVEVYVGQVWAVFGGVLVEAGVLGLALALTLAAARALVAVPRPGMTEPVATDAHTEPDVTELEVTDTEDGGTETSAREDVSATRSHTDAPESVARR